jgi:GR25 family glycosyltransferase involved in LPS biosynthesis
MFSNHFDKIFAINLAEATERWQVFLLELQKIGVSPNEIIRMEAVDGNLLPQKEGLKKGELGCLMSHVKILQLAQQANYERILIFEDDVKFHDKFSRLFPKYIRQVPENWDMLYFGGNHSETPLPFSKNVLQVMDMRCTHAYAVHQRMYQTLIDNLQNCNVPIDIFYTQIQRKYKCYVFYPHVAWQHAGESYIRKENVNYVSIRKYRTPFKPGDLLERPGDAIRRIAEKFARACRRIF